MKKLFYSSILSAFTLFSFASCGETRPTEVNTEQTQVESKYITVEKAKVQEIIAQEDPFILDVRTPDEFNGGHIENAVNINFYDSNFDAEVEKLEKNKTIVVYCAAGGRSASAAEKMLKMGFTSIVEVKGGYNAWKTE